MFRIPVFCSAEKQNGNVRLLSCLLPASISTNFKVCLQCVFTDNCAAAAVLSTAQRRIFEISS